jgi:hypothetical protein
MLTDFLHDSLSKELAKPRDFHATGNDALRSLTFNTI